MGVSGGCSETREQYLRGPRSTLVPEFDCAPGLAASLLLMVRATNDGVARRNLMRALFD